ncbi:MAG: hypothetical protein H0U76_01265 [Ktedonobacteraceae bacterium]|nr:hypothetical protein [Ktedonobacteraceae bacterium]
MAVTDRAPLKRQSERLNWKKPRTKAKWLWFACSLLLYAGITAWYFYALKTQKYPSPSNDPFRLFGIVAFGLVLLVACYSLRRRFIRILPGHVQDWLWLHTWFGITSILIALEHENYQNLKDFYHVSPGRFLEAGGGISALYALILLVISGIVGRLIDVQQARRIAAEARHNGVGIAGRVEERLHEFELLIERLGAGKSAEFKQFSTSALKSKNIQKVLLPQCEPNEQEDFGHVCDVLSKRAELLKSLQRLQRAQFLIQLWRSVHIPLACLALGIICTHSLVELAKMALHLILHK